MAKGNVCFVATAFVNSGKQNIILPDENGCYYQPVGGLAVYNSAGHFYDYDESVKVFEKSGDFMRRLQKRAVKAELGHPKMLPGMTERQFIARLRDIDDKNVCATHTQVDIVKDQIKDSKGNPVIAIMSKVSPSGPYGPALKASYENGNENVYFSIRSLTEDDVVAGVRHKIIREVITFDQVNEGGIEFANKMKSPSLEGYDIVDIVDKHILKDDLMFGVRDLIKAKERAGLESATVVLSAISLFNLLGYDTRNLRGSDINFLNW